MADYQKVEDKDYNARETETAHNSRIFLLRQVAIGSAICSSFFQLGLLWGYPPVVIAQLRLDNVTVTDEQASWFSSTPFYASIPWGFILPLMSFFIGMRLTFAFAACCTIIGFVTFSLSKSLTQLFIGSSIQGVLTAAQITIAVNSITDYTSPTYRGLFLTIKSASIHWGIWVGNAIGVFSHWKFIGILGTVCGVFNLLMVIIWPESPCWLANKGRYEQCRKVHRWLKGTSLEAEEELEKLINCYKTAASINAEKNLSKIKITLNDVCSKEWYKPVLLSCLLIILLLSTGKYVVATYALDIIHKITGYQSTAYVGMMILDGVSVIGMYIGSFLTRYFKRRTMFFGLETVTLIMLCFVSLYLYLIKREVFVERSYVSITLLSIYMLSLCCGPMLLSSALYGELMPLRGRTVANGVINIVFIISQGVLIKISPDMFKNFGLHGGFLTLVIVSIIPYVVLFKYLPETENKTLTEIESLFKDDNETKSKIEEFHSKDLVLISEKRALRK